MTKIRQTPSPRHMALLGGIGLFVMLAAVILAVPNTTNLIVKGDATKTVQHIMEAGHLFRLGILGWFTILVCDIIVAWALYEYFRPINRGVSLLTAWLRLFYTAVFAVMITNMLVVLMLTNGSNVFGAFPKAQLNAMILLFLKIFEHGWLFALGFFGMHLLGLGILALQDADIPRFFGVLLIVASACYIADTMAFIALPNYPKHESTVKMLIGLPMAAGELAFACWLVFKGGKARQPNTMAEN